MSVDISIRLDNLQAVQEAFSRLSAGQAKAAFALALNDTGGKVQKAMRPELRNVFDRTTNYIANSPWVTRATADKLSVSVGPRKVSGRGIDPQKILQAQQFGGRRADKRMEVAFKAMGLLPSGMQVALPAEQYGGPYPGSDDGKGNFTGNFVRKLLAYFKANLSAIQAMGTRQRNRELRRYEFQSNMRSRREIKLMDGKEWFVSPGGPGRLGPGIWVRGGGEFRCAVAFVSPANYGAPRLDMNRLARSLDLQPYLDKRVRFRIREAAGV